MKANLRLRLLLPSLALSAPLLVWVAGCGGGDATQTAPSPSKESESSYDKIIQENKAASKAATPKPGRSRHGHKSAK